MSIFAPKFQKQTIMANITTLPEEGQILVDIEDLSMLKDIKKAISIVKSVGKITLPKRRRYSSYERSMRDLDKGRVYEYDSLKTCPCASNIGTHSDLFSKKYKKRQSPPSLCRV